MQKLVVTIIFFCLISGVLLEISKNSPPQSSLYTVKRLEENITLQTKSTPSQKAEYYSNLLDKRLSELTTLVPNKKEHTFVLSSSLRYSTTAGEYTKLIKDNNLKDYASKARKQFNDHTIVLKKLSTKYSKNNKDDRGNQFIIDAVNYLNIYGKELPI